MSDLLGLLEIEKDEVVSLDFFKGDTVCISKDFPNIEFVSKDIPDRIVATYVDDLDILEIHKCIQTIFIGRRMKIPHIKKKIKVYHERIKKALSLKLTANDIRSLQECIARLEAKVLSFGCSEEWKIYIDAAYDILINYQKISSDKTKGFVSFETKIEDETIIQNRIKLINKYLEIARNYIEINVVNQNNLNKYCPGNCGTDFSKIETDEELGSCICPACGYVQDMLSKMSFYKEPSRVGINNRNDYQDIENFIKVLDRFEGKQNNNIPEKLYFQLDEYYVSIYLHPGSYYRDLPLEKEEKTIELILKPGTSPKMLKEGLIKTQNSAFFDDNILIGHIYYGWKLPDLSLYRPKIIEDYIKTQSVYYELPVEFREREASLHTQFRLLVQLLAVGFPCDPDHFFIQGSRESLENHQRLWKIMCELTGVPYHEII